jgi:hypothetical protein
LDGQAVLPTNYCSSHGNIQWGIKFLEVWAIKRVTNLTLAIIYQTTIFKPFAQQHHIAGVTKELV